MKSLILFFCITSYSCAFAQTNSDTPGTRIKVESLKKGELSIWDVFQQRRSVRKYKPDPIPPEDILKIIDAARMAPTSGNQQPWKFLIITDKNKINEMKDACIKETIEYLKKNNEEIDTSKKEEITNVFNDYFSAPVYIIVLTDNNSIYSSYNHWDGPLAAGYLLLAARALGYGTVFITDSVPESVTKEVFNIPDNYIRVCITPVGIPVEWPPTPKKKPLKEFIINETF
ncbi:MAG TPA: nitroreductase family protein [Candidatus Acidoferrales bacterium]|nr:nitroreductase family protein [Candidatus Acidoferrales bacterium]